MTGADRCLASRSTSRSARRRSWLRRSCTSTASPVSSSFSPCTFPRPDTLPVVFSGGTKTEGIKCWDVRASQCVYELSTGNTAVQGIAWSPETSTLYAATECTYKDWIGYHHDYRDFHARAIQDTDILPPRKPNSHGYWPDRAGRRTTRGRMSCASSSWCTFLVRRWRTGFVVRYAFKGQPELAVAPIYGDARPGGTRQRLYVHDVTR